MNETRQDRHSDDLEDLERNADAAFFGGDLHEALRLYLDVIREGTNGIVVATRVADALERTIAKLTDIQFRLQPAATRAAELRAAAQQAVESGNLAHAAHLRVRLGDALVELGEDEDAESAYREAVAFSRQVDADDPELMLYTFRALTNFLVPSEESIALAAELGANLIERDEMYHPMRAADAACHWAVTELRFAAITPDRLDHVLTGIVEHAIDMLDETCLHGQAQKLRLRAADALRAIDRDAEADHWEQAAIAYEDWDHVMDQQIPGHVHLWDLRFGQ